MSMAPNNPFEDNQGQSSGQPPKKQGSPWLKIFAILGVIGIIGMMVCCGGVYYMYKAGTGLVAEQIKMELDGNPVITEHIGDISSMSMNLSAVMEEAQKKQAAGDNSPPSMVFDIEGSKGSGQILLSEDQMKGSGGTVTLVMSDGTRHDVDMGSGFGGGSDFGADMDMDIEMGDIDIGEVQEEAAAQ